MSRSMVKNLMAVRISALERHLLSTASRNTSSNNDVMVKTFPIYKLGFLLILSQPTFLIRLITFS